MTKFSLFAGLVLTTVLATAPVFAAPDVKPGQPEGEKKTEDLVAAPSVSPKAQVDNFFARLTEGRVDVAYDQLIKGTKIDEVPKDVAMLKMKTREAIRIFGSLDGYEVVDLKEVGRHLKRLTCLSLGKKFPIRWRFYFYEADGVWKLIDIRIDDRLIDLFEEPAPAAAPASAK